MTSNQKLLAALFASALGAGQAGAQNVIIGDSNAQTVTITSGTTPYNTLILGNQTTGDGTLNFSGGTINVTHPGSGYSGFVTVGNAGIGTLNHSNADANAVINITGPQYVGPPPATLPGPWGGYLFIGRTDGGSGTYTMSDALNANTLQLNVQNEIQIGGSNVSTAPGGGFSCFATCSGNFVQDGGTVTAGGVTLGIGNGTGAYTINSGTLNAFIDLGNTGSGTVVQTGGVVNATGMFIGNSGGSAGVYQSNAGTLNSGSFLLLGVDGQGIFNQDGGDHVAHALLIGTGTGAGFYNLNSGNLTISNGLTDQLVVGHNGAGTFTMTGGTVVIQNQDVNTGALIVGNNSGSVGIFTQTGGDVQGGRSLTIGANGGTGTYNLNNADPGFAPTTTLSTGFISLGFSGTGTFNQSDGTRNTTSDIYIGAGSGTYNLSGGDLIVTDSGLGSGIILGTFGTGVFNQSGGTNTANELNIGQNSATGTYNQTGGVVTLGSGYDGQIQVDGQPHAAYAATLTVGASGNGTYNLGQTGQLNNAQWGGYPTPAFPGDFPTPPVFDNAANAPYLQLFGNAIIGRDVGSTGTFTLAGDGSVLQINAAAGVNVTTPNGTMVIGLNGTGNFTQNDQSTVSVDGGLAIGLNQGAVGAYTISAGTNGAGSLWVGGDLNIGGSDNVGGPTAQTTAVAGNGMFNQNDGNVHVVGNLNIATNQGAVGNYNMAGGTLQVDADARIGNNGGTGTFTQTGGDVAIVGALHLGTTPASGPVSTGNYQLTTGTLTTGFTIVGDTSVGTFNQSGGTHTTNELTLGATSFASGTYAMSGGDLVVNGQMFVGKGDGNLNPTMLNGLFQQSGGNVSAAQIFIGGSFDDPNSHFGTGRYELSGGTVNSQFTSVGFLGQGSVLQTGGTFNNTGELQLGGSGLFSTGTGTVSDPFVFYSSGTYDLQGGVLNTGNTTVGVFGQGTFNQSGASQHIVTNNLIVGSQPGLIELNSGVARQGIYSLSDSGLLIVGGDAIIGAGNSGFVGEPGAKGTFTQSGGNFIVTGGINPGDGNLIVGQGSGSGASAGATGSYNLSGGSLTVATATVIGGDAAPGLGGTGTFTQTGGTHTTTFLSVGGANATGTYDLSGTGVVNSGITYVGAGVGSSGTFTQHGGTQNTAFLNIGLLGGATGTYNMSGGQASISDSMNVGGGTSGTVNQSGGVVDVAFILTVNGTGTYNLTNGSLTTFRTVIGDSSGNAAFNQSGGTHTVGTGPGATNGGDQVLYLGSIAGGTGTYTLSAGALNVLGNSNPGNSALTVGASGTGTFIQTGGTVTANGLNSLAIGDFGNGSGEYRLSNGSLVATGNAFVGAHTQGTMLQTGGAVSIGGDLYVGYATNAVGQYTMNASASNGAPSLQVTGNLQVGVNGGGVTGRIDQSSGTTTVDGEIQLGVNAGSQGTMHVSGGSNVVLTGASTTARVVVGNAGTGLLTLDGVSTMTLPGSGSVIVGLTSSASGTLIVTGASSLNAGSLLGIGHNGTTSTGASATVIVDDILSSITATSIYVGAGGCLGGNGVIHGTVIMDGATASLNQCPQLHGPLPLASNGLVNPNGILNPGRSPGRLVIDGGFDFISGTIVLEVESDGLGGFLFDQLVFGPTCTLCALDLLDMNIVFSFLGNTDPTAFENSGLWNLNTFFKTTTDPNGLGPDMNISSGLGKSLSAIFGQSCADQPPPGPPCATFAAQSDAYDIQQFAFTTDGESGVVTLVAPPNDGSGGSTVPEPGTMALVLLGSLMLLLAARRREPARRAPSA